MLYSLQDITLIPAHVSKINSRSECNPYDSYDRLPLFTAPMTPIINDQNWQEFGKYVHTIIPRNISIERRLELAIDTFIAISLDEFKTYFIDVSEEEFETLSKNTRYICIDVANGHMERLLDYCKIAKNKWQDKLILMAGNVANPYTYIEYAFAGIDYCRMSIGSGSQCTTANTGVYYPMGSLIEKTVKLRNEYIEYTDLYDENDIEPEIIKWPKIVADGGFNTFGDIIKALVLGADYVMCGKIFAKSVEACGKIHSKVHPLNYDMLKDGPFDEWIRTQNIDRIKMLECYREYYGMSTKRAQVEFGKEGNKTEEGIASLIKIEYFLEDWTQCFTDYLKSAMSYTNAKNLNEFVGKVEYEILSPTAIRMFK